jgi:hypothetical protein
MDAGKALQICCAGGNSAFSITGSGFPPSRLVEYALLREVQKEMGIHRRAIW